MPKGDIVGIKLYFPLVTTLIQFYVVTELIIQLPVLSDHSSDNQVLQFTSSISEATKWIKTMWSSAVITKQCSSYQAL